MIEQNSFGYNENEKEKNWAYEKARRELNKHKEQKPIDHPDGSVTTEKLADNGVTTKKLADKSVTEPKLADGSVSRKKLSGEVGEELAGLGQKIREAYDKAVTALGLGAQLEILQQQLLEEVLARSSADDGLRAELKNLDVSELRNELLQEKSDRNTDFNILMGFINLLTAASHKHANKTVLDAITPEKIMQWDEATDITDLKNFVTQILYGNVNQFRDIYAALGVNQYDGGLFGMEYVSAACLDGASFTDEEIRQTTDGGVFELSRSVMSRVKDMETILGTLESKLDEING